MQLEEQSEVAIIPGCGTIKSAITAQIWMSRILDPTEVHTIHPPKDPKQYGHA